ncbi:hypothetical protein LTR53_005107 [Teratosphaeriaceae sp. CCFEE 6253]|nr:hypothetical protein LTR53_005107 [Teratosphaeriaceae sp. CCFEE 6253]
MINETPRKDRTKSRPEAQQSNPRLWREFGSLALQLGFKTTKAERFAAQDSRLDLVAKTIEHLGYHVRDNRQVTEDLITTLSRLRGVAGDYVPPQYVANTTLASDKRYGRPFEEDHYRDKGSLFLPAIYQSVDVSAEDITTAYRKRHMFRTFFDITTEVGLVLDIAPPETEGVPSDAQSSSQCMCDELRVQLSAVKEELRSKTVEVTTLQGNMLVKDSEATSLRHSAATASTSLSTIQAVLERTIAELELARNAAAAQVRTAEGEITRLKTEVAEAWRSENVLQERFQSLVPSQEAAESSHVLELQDLQGRLTHSEGPLTAPRDSLATAQEESAHDAKDVLQQQYNRGLNEIVESREQTKTARDRHAADRKRWKASREAELKKIRLAHAQEKAGMTASMETLAEAGRKREEEMNGTTVRIEQEQEATRDGHVAIQQQWQVANDELRAEVKTLQQQLEEASKQVDEYDAIAYAQEVSNINDRRAFADELAKIQADSSGALAKIYDSPSDSKNFLYLYICDYPDQAIKIRTMIFPAFLARVAVRSIGLCDTKIINTHTYFLGEDTRALSPSHLEQGTRDQCITWLANEWITQGSLFLCPISQTRNVKLALTSGWTGPNVRALAGRRPSPSHRALESGAGPSGQIAVVKATRREKNKKATLAIESGAGPSGQVAVVSGARGERIQKAVLAIMNAEEN